MTDADEALARRRYNVLNLTRVVGIALVMLGLAINEGAIEAPKATGIPLTVVGVLTFFLIPNIIARRWRSDDA